MSEPVLIKRCKGRHSFSPEPDERVRKLVEEKTQIFFSFSFLPFYEYFFLKNEKRVERREREKQICSSPFSGITNYENRV